MDFETALIPLLAGIPLVLMASGFDSPSWSRLRSRLLEHLALVTSRGLPIAPSLRALAQEHNGSRGVGRFYWHERSKREAEALLDLAQGVERSGSLALAMEEVPRLATPRLISVLRAAEARGALADTLESEHAIDQAADRARWRWVEASFYPLVVATVIGTASVFMGLVIQPKLTSIANHIDGEQAYFWPTLSAGVSFGFHTLVMCAALVLTLYWTGSRPGRILASAILRVGRQLPWVGGPLRRRGHAQWLRHLGGFLRAGVELPQALKDAADQAAPGQDRLLLDAARLAREGRGLDAVLAAALGPRDHDSLTKVILDARTASSLPDGLQRASQRLAQRSEERLVVIGGALQPVPMLICACVLATHLGATWSLLLRTQDAILRSM